MGEFFPELQLATSGVDLLGSFSEHIHLIILFFWRLSDLESLYVAQRKNAF